ncbi:hypothetical protein ACFWXK_11285 [Streptomyces sp. NPDC059070]|uniref:hypothetical protein n=1 Tax=Streptomyces sp. NPDC059070 TaxID=3346713 RepID=UPI003696FE18
MRIPKTLAIAMLAAAGATAAVAPASATATVAPASITAKPFAGPEKIEALKLTAPTTVEFSYRCNPGAPRRINVGLTAPGTDFDLWIPAQNVVCNGKDQHAKVVLTKSQFGKDRKLKPGDKATVWLRFYDGPSDDVMQMREMTAS